MVEKLTPGRRTFLKALGGGALFSGLSGVVSATPSRQPGPKKDEILVGVSASASDMEKTVEQAVPGNARIVHQNETLRYVAVKFPAQAPDHAKENFIDAITKKDHVKYAEKNATHEALYTPNDPLFGDQYADQQVNAQTAWEETLGDAGVTIAVVDQGVKYDHPDLQGNMAADPGYDFVDNDPNPYPDDLSREIHGTHVSGIAAAGVDNGIGVTGIGNSTILSARALGEDGTGYVSDIADGIQWAAEQGADVINLSLGGGGPTQTMQTAVSYATANGALVVAAAGNSGSRGVSYPAAYNECLAVSALDPDESLAYYSQYGEAIELAAPGTNVLSTWTDDGYERISGTSMATPVVAGVAGLTLAKWTLTNAELRTHLKNTAVDVGLSRDKQGAGRVDAGNAVTTRPGDGGSGGGGGESTSGSVSDSLYGYRDYDDYTWSWTYSSPSTVVVELDGPNDADFDLYVTTGTTQNASPGDYDYASYTPDSRERITIDAPDDSTTMQIDVDSYRGSGGYTLTITEYR
ncbi:MAG TPA: S8 family peptidase [Halococcus sp.]|nr:S8 family peptidase [Halococcus sp.]